MLNIAAVESSHNLQSISEPTTTEIALIHAAAKRAELLRQKSQNFTAEERQIIRWGEQAMQQLLEGHQKLILRFVAQYQSRGYNSCNADLEQEAAIAFFNAVTTYNPNKGARLSTWAYFQIRARLQKVTGISIKEAVATAKTLQSEPTFTAPEMISEPGLLKQLCSMIPLLTERQQNVVWLRLNDWSWVEIGSKLQSTADAVRMVWTRAIRRLRQLLLGEQQREESKPEIAESQTQLEPRVPWSLFQRLVRSLVRPSPIVNWQKELIVLNDASVNCQHTVIQQFWSDPVCSGGVRGSPLLPVAITLTDR